MRLKDTLNERQQELYVVYDKTEVNVYAPYTHKFTAVNSPIFATTEAITLDSQFLMNIEAELFDRDSAIPTLSIDGFKSTSYRPKMLGGKLPVSALEQNQAGIGVPPVMVGGKLQSGTAYKAATKISYIKRAIEYSKANMSNEVFATSSIKELNANFDPTGISNKGDLTITGDEMLTVKLIEIWREYRRANLFVPKIIVGDEVLKQIISEVKSSEGKRVKGDYEMGMQGEGSNANAYIKVDFMNVAFEVFSPMKEYKGNDIDTANLVQFYCEDTLLMAYAVLEAVDKADNSFLLSAEMAIGQTDTNKETARGSVFVKSAPLPIIVKNELIYRYNWVKP